jgi:hypothetical protein
MTEPTTIDADITADPVAGDTPDVDTDATADDTAGVDQLGDPGKQALDRMKAQLKAERAAKRDLERKLAEATKPGEGDPLDPDTLREEGRKAALEEITGRLVASEIRAAAAGKLNDPADAIRFLDLTQFDVAADGSIDPDEIADAINDLVTQKPYLAKTDPTPPPRFQGSADGGAQGRERPLTRDDLARMSAEEINAALEAGRLKHLLGQ